MQRIVEGRQFFKSHQRIIASLHRFFSTCNNNNNKSGGAKVEEFPLPKVEAWFPPHMQNGLDHLQRLVTDVDLVLEVRDARLPFQSKNIALEQIFKSTNSFGREIKRILIFNKKELSDPINNNKLEKLYKELIKTNRAGNILKVMFVNALKEGYLKDIIHTIKNLYLNPNDTEILLPTRRVVIVGVPNIGKSTIINQLRKMCTGIDEKAVRVGKEAGVTRSTGQMVKILTHPIRIFLLDSPGILLPKINNQRMGYNLALIGCVNPQVLDLHSLSQYLLNFLLEHGDKNTLIHGLLKPAPCKYAKMDPNKRPKYLSKMDPEVLSKSEPIPLKELLKSKYRIPPLVSDFIPMVCRQNRLLYVNSSDGDYKLECSLQAGYQFLIASFQSGKLGRFTIEIAQQKALQKDDKEKSRNDQSEKNSNGHSEKYTNGHSEKSINENESTNESEDSTTTTLLESNNERQSNNEENSSLNKQTEDDLNWLIEREFGKREKSKKEILQKKEAVKLEKIENLKTLDRKQRRVKLSLLKQRQREDSKVALSKGKMTRL